MPATGRWMSLTVLLTNYCKSRICNYATLRSSDWEYFLNRDNVIEIEQNIKIRNVDAEIRKLHSVFGTLGTSKQHLHECQELMGILEKMPNKTHPNVVVGDYSQAKAVYKINGHLEEECSQLSDFNVESVLEDARLLRMRDLNVLSGDKTYTLMAGLADLEQALLKYTVDFLKERGYIFREVPNVIDEAYVKSCGFAVDGPTTQVYQPLGSHLRLAGTGEIPLAASLVDTTFDETELPLRLMTVSRCYRAETATTARERGLYRVTQFNKVEMFVVARHVEESDELLEEIRTTQHALFQSLGLYCRQLDMPSEELGLPAYRKYDTEAWMPGLRMWGEISSASSCTDYQARRLRMRWRDGAGRAHLCHTLNGTGCAAPRMIKALCEQAYRGARAALPLPAVLHPYLRGQTELSVSPLPESRFTAVSRRYINEMHKLRLRRYSAHSTNTDS